VPVIRVVGGSIYFCDFITVLGQQNTEDVGIRPAQLSVSFQKGCGIHEPAAHCREEVK
jgi:hypothetical protein